MNSVGDYLSSSYYSVQTTCFSSSAKDDRNVPKIFKCMSGFYYCVSVDGKKNDHKEKQRAEIN